jgi:type I phosphodiesterase/nucleotide pyrophosphatase
VNRNTASESADPRVDDLRRRLRELGYLDAGVDRFVLGAVRRTRRPAIIALFASLRIGLLTAALLGPAAVIGLIARLPGLITGLRDGIVAALYLGVFFGVTVAALAFGTALLASWAATRRGAGSAFTQRVRILSIVAGIVVTAASVAYLTLWWRTATAGSQSLGWTAFALAVAVAISVMLGHAVMVTALAVTMARPGEESAVPQVPGRSWKASLAGSAIAFIGAATLLFAVAGEMPQGERHPQLSVGSSGSRVVVLAIDGFDWRFQERQGTFMWAAGARADLAPFDSTDPARLWTTIATGVRPETHGVTILETRRIAGLQGSLGGGSTAHVIGAASDILRLTRPSIASTLERRVKTFWEVADQAGLRTASVNWWATWPAAEASGIVISDRAIVRLERGGPLDAEIAPADVYERLRSQWSVIQEAANREAGSRMFRQPSIGIPDEVKSTLTRSAVLDATLVKLAEEVRRKVDLDLLVVYLPGLDIAQHTLLSGETTAPPSELNLRISALAEYYEFLNQLTANIVGTQERVFLVAQPGRLHQGPGMMAVKGPGIDIRGHAAGTTLDIAPTVLHALGVPMARDLDGNVLTGLFTAESLSRFPVRYVSTYGRRGAVPVARGSQPLDQEAIDRLRSLGYVR